MQLIDVTKESVYLLKAIQQLCGQGNSWKSNFTSAHFVDIFKGNKTEEVVLNGIFNNRLLFVHI